MKRPFSSAGDSGQYGEVISVHHWVASIEVLLELEDSRSVQSNGEEKYSDGETRLEEMRAKAAVSYGRDGIV